MENQIERTLVIIKPDGLQRQLSGRIITRFEEKGLKIVGGKLTRISSELAKRHYAEHEGKPFYAGLLAYMTSSPVWVMVLEAKGVVAMARKIMGETFGYEAQAGTIRGDFGSSRGFNLVHGSDSDESARREIALYFEEGEILAYSLANEHWIVGT